MRHEIGCSHVTGENKSDHARVRAEEKENADDNLDHSLNV